MALFGNYEKTGAGIAKDAPKKKPFFRFWELVGGKFWKLLELNLLMMLTFLPLVLIYAVILLLGQSETQLAIGLILVLLLLFAVLLGPSVAASTQILRNFIREKPCFLLKTYFRTFRSSFRQACPLGLIDLLVLSSAGSSFVVYPAVMGQLHETNTNETAAAFILFIVTLSISLVVLMASAYAYLMIVSTELKLLQIIKNALALCFLALWRNLLTLVISAAVLAVFLLLTWYIPAVMLVLWLFMPVSFIGFIVVFNCYPVVQKYVINPYYTQRGEVNPELVAAEDASVFVDRGGKETPSTPRKKPQSRNKGSRGRTIS